ncbi:predicted protein [Arabidopsis lyrata subsp. lyrata]|uniref:Predicted protein n=1 Tax=Arabidopsis lyrata subsp. lyrata TaxID=81972 RepID=D7KS58_ARALL|nr:predicted protein [Arabidopsis lyrata subsp. lyrata]
MAEKWKKKEGLEEDTWILIVDNSREEPTGFYWLTRYYSVEQFWRRLELQEKEY